MEESNLKVASNTSTRFDSFLMGGLLTEVNWIQLHHKRNIWKCLLHSVIFFPVTISVVFTPFSAEFELSHGMIHSKYFSRSDAKIRRSYIYLIYLHTGELLAEIP